MAIAGVGGRLRAVKGRLFAPRDLIMRTEGRVKYVTLTPRFQMISASVLLVALSWFAFSSVQTMLTDYRISRLDAERDQAKTAYLQLLTQLADYYDQFSSLTKNMQQNEKVMLGMLSQDGSGPLRDKALAFASGLKNMAELNRTLTGDIADLKDRLGSSEQTLSANLTMLQQRLKLTEEDRVRIVEARQRIDGQLRNVESQVAGANEGNAAVEGTIAVLRNRLEDAQKAEITSNTAQRELTTQIAGLTQQLTTVRSNKSQLERQIEQLAQRLDTAGADKSELERQVALLTGNVQTAAREKQELEQKLASMNGDLDHNRAAAALMSQQVGITQQSLAAVIAQRNALHAVQRQLHDRVGELESQLALMQSSQQTLMASITQRTRTNVDEMKKVVAMTGLDVDDMLSRAAEQISGGTGGPFIPASLTVNGTADMATRHVLLASVETLDGEVNRWERLQYVLHSLPLSTPLDHFTIGSSFGRRIDPFNGRPALHEGLDFTGLVKTPVLATAPGRVVFAGWSGGYGRMVEIDHGLGIHTRYAHLMQIDVEVGDTVDYRQDIGLLGSSGRSTGPHCHYEVRVDGRPYDPMNFLKAGKYMFKG
jgi:murein DD-endopeptidase MepM/ murein hydrolase activator NlpD